MADGKITIEIDGDDSGLTEKLDNVKISAGELAQKGLSAATKATAAMTAAMGAAATAAISVGSAYETAFAQVETIMDTSVTSVEDMSDAILNLSNETGQASTDLSDAVYNAISATGDTANAVELVGTASKLATAGFAEQSDSLSVLTTIMNAYGMSADEAEQISDSLVQTQNLGVTTVAQLASSMGKAIASASAYNIDLTNLESAYVSLTKAGISTEESTTYLSSMFSELGDSGSDVAGILKSKTGKSFGELMDDGESLGDVLQILIDYVDGDSEALMNLWGSAEAGKAAASIAGQGIETFNENLENLGDCSGTTEEAYKTMSQTLSYQTDRLVTRVQNFGTAIYDAFSDDITNGVSSLSDAFEELYTSATQGDLADDLAQLGESLGNFVDKAADAVSNAIPKLVEFASFFLDNLGTLATLIGGVATAYFGYEAAVIAAKIATEGFTVAFNANPIGLAVSGIILAGTAFVALGEAMNTQSEDLQLLNEENQTCADTTQAIADSLANTQTAYANTRAEIITANQTNEQMIENLILLVNGYDGTAASAQRVQDMVAALNSAIPGLNLAFDEETGALNMTQEALEANNDEYEKMQEWSAAQDRLTDAKQNYTDAVNALTVADQAVADAQAEYDNYVATYGTLGQLAAKGDTARVNALNGLSDALDTAKDNQDDANRLYMEAADAVMDATVAESAAEDAYYDSVDATADATEATEENTDATEENTDATEDNTDAAQDNSELMWDMIKTYSECGNSSDELTKAHDELESQLEANRDTMTAAEIATTEYMIQQLELQATIAGLGEEMGNLAEVAGINLPEVAQLLIDTGTSASQFASSVSSSIDSVINSYQKYDTESWVSLTDAQAALTSNAQKHAEWLAGIQALWQQAVDSGDAGQMAYVQSLYNMGTDSYNIVMGLKDDTTGLLAEMAGEYGVLAGDASEEVILGLSMEEGVAYDPGLLSGEDYGNGLVDGASEAEPEAVAEEQVENTQEVWTNSYSTFEDVGETVMTKIGNGMDSNKKAVTSASSDAATSAKSSFIGVPWSLAGSSAIQYIANGISNNVSYVTSAASSAASSAKTTFTGIAWSGAGSSAIQYIANGVSNNTSILNTAAYQAGQKALAAIKRGLGITSGSSVGSSTTSLSASALTSARLAVTPTYSSVGTSSSSYSSTAYGGEAGTGITITVPLAIDGREFARATTKYITRQQAFGA